MGTAQSISPFVHFGALGSLQAAAAVVLLLKPVLRCCGVAARQFVSCSGAALFAVMWLSAVTAMTCNIAHAGNHELWVRRHERGQYDSLGGDSSMESAPEGSSKRLLQLLDPWSFHCSCCFGPAPVASVRSDFSCNGTLTQGRILLFSRCRSCSHPISTNYKQLSCQAALLHAGKLALVQAVCKRVGVHTEPACMEGVWIVPLLSW